MATNPNLSISAEFILQGEQFAEAFTKELNRAQGQAQKFERAIQGEFDKITGVKASQQAELIAKGLERAGGAAKLTSVQLDNLRTRIDALARSGAKLPSALAALQKPALPPLPTGPGVGGVLAGNIQAQGLSQLQGQLGPLGGLLNGLEGSALGAAAAVGTVAVAVGAAATATVSAISEFAAFGSKLTDLAASTNLSTTALQEFAFVGSSVNVSVDQVASASAKLSQKVAEGSKAFEKIGLSVGDLRALAPEEQLREVADAIAAIEDPTEQVAAAIALFGKSGAAMLPFLKSLREGTEEARRLGIVLGEEAVAKADALDDASAKLSKTWEGLKNNFANAISGSGLLQSMELLTTAIGTASVGAQQLGDNLFAVLANVGALNPVLSATARSLDQISQAAGLIEAIRRAGDTSGDEKLPTARLPGPPVAPDKPPPTGVEDVLFEAELRRRDQAQRAAEDAAKAQQASADRAAKAWADSAEKARVEWDKFFESMDKAGADALSDMLTLVGGRATSGADRQTAGILQQIEAVVEIGESFSEAEGKAAEFLKTFDLLTKLPATQLANQSDAGLQQLGEQLAALDQSIPGVAEALAQVNAEIARRGGQPIISGAEVARIEKARKQLEELASHLHSLAFALDQVGGLFEALGVSAESGAARAVSALVGISDAAGTFVETLASGNIFDKIGAGIGLATSLVKGIGGLFSESDAEKAGKIAGRVLGVAISEELAKAISETAKSLGIAKEAASLLHLGDAMDESGESAASFADEMNSLLEAIELGAVPAAEGIEAVGDAFSRLADEAADGSVAAQAAMGGLAQRARELGQSIPEIDEAVRSAVGESAGALGGLGGINLVDADDARAQAQIFLNVFNGVLATDGIIAAANAIKPALDTFREQLADAGIGKGVADSILGPISGAMSLLKNDMTKGGAEGAQALKTILEGQLKAGFLDVNTFTAIQQQAGTAFDQMIEGGANTQAALQAIAPLLAQIQQTASATGQAVDPVTQGLIAQAQAAGIAFPTDTGQQMVTLLQQIVTQLGGIPATFQEIGSASTSTFGTIAAEATATSSTVAGAFDGVGEQITSAILPVADQIQGELAGVFDGATASAQQFASLLGKLDSTSLTIPVKFEPGGIGGLEGTGTRIESFQGGTHGIRDFGSETIAALHGREAVIPEHDLRSLLGAAVGIGRSSGGGRGGAPQVIQVLLDGRVLAQTQVKNERRNLAGTVSQKRRDYR